MKNINLPIPIIIPLEKNNFSFSKINSISNFLTNSFLERSDKVTFNRDDIDVFMGEFDFPDEGLNIMHIYSVCIFSINIENTHGKPKRRDLNRIIDIIQLKINQTFFDIYNYFNNEMKLKNDVINGDYISNKIAQLESDFGKIHLGHKDKKRSYSYECTINYHFIDEFENYFANKILSELTPLEEIH